MLENRITPSSFLGNLAQFYNCQITWWDEEKIYGTVVSDDYSEAKGLVPDKIHLKRLLYYRHPLVINKGRHHLCSDCIEAEGCRCTQEVFIPVEISQKSAGVLWRFLGSSPIDTTLWLKSAIDFSQIAAFLESEQKEYLQGEFFRQIVEFFGKLQGEGVILFDDQDKIIYQNEKAKELNLYQHFLEYKETPLEQNHRKAIKLNLVLDKDNSLPAYLRHYYYSDRYLGKTLMTHQSGLKTKNVDFLIPRKSINFQNIISTNPQMLKAISTAHIVAMTDSTVLLRGESGTGKEMFARAIHKESLRKDGPFIAINCAAIPENLLESELFGYEEGSFTGAKKGGKPGKLELANNGTIFLDEIGDMPLALQAKLLRVLQNKTIERVGGTKQIPINARIITATHRNLEEMIKENKFREDLFYRINVIPINIPPLKERPEDIELLLNYFIRKYCILLNKNFMTFTYEAMEILKSYSWPGNVRELENAVEYSVAITKTDEIGIENLPNQFQTTMAEKQSLQIMSKQTAREIDREQLRNLLEQFGQTTDGKREIARNLGISLATLYRWIKKYKL